MNGIQPWHGALLGFCISSLVAAAFWKLRATYYEIYEKIGWSGVSKEASFVLVLIVPIIIAAICLGVVLLMALGALLGFGQV